ncbi:hypothetical protein GCM10010330_77310 [Streptomyces tendae]|nr:hypothetical protein GCM10010330_77310 [Streptomyces tendae]
MLAEIGDDRNRFADARGLKAYAGSSPITKASGKKSSVTRRWIKNDRLNHVGYLWAFSAITASTGAKAHCRRRRDQGDWHASAQRNLFNRMIGQLFHCLQHGVSLDEAVAFPMAPEALAARVRQPPTARDQRSRMTRNFCSNSASRIRLAKAPGIVSERPRTRTARSSHRNPPRVWCCRFSIRVISLQGIERRPTNVRMSCRSPQGPAGEVERSRKYPRAR